jgi:hypothetical protein
MLTGNFGACVSPSAMIKLSPMSIIDPAGATIVKRVGPALELFQKLASESRGGLDMMCAGVEVETLVSEISKLLEEVREDAQLIEQVAKLPCALGGE